MGMISEKEAEEIKRIAKEGGPGGCETKEECKKYCEDPKNSQECIYFISNQGYMTEDAIKKMEEELDKIEDLIEHQIKEFKDNYQGDYDIDVDEEEIKREIEEQLKPYKDVIDSYKKRSSLNGVSRSIASKLYPSVLKQKAGLIVKALEGHNRGMADFLNNFMASSVEFFLK